MTYFPRIRFRHFAKVLFSQNFFLISEFTAAHMHYIYVRRVQSHEMYKLLKRVQFLHIASTQ